MAAASLQKELGRMRYSLYNLYNRVGIAVAQTGVSRWFGPQLRSLLAQIDLFLRTHSATRLASPATIGEFLLHFPGDGLFALELAQSQTIEPLTTQRFRSLLQPGMTFVDVGAHIGWYALNAAAILHNNQSVYAFEPDPLLFNSLQQNLVANNVTGKVVATQQAVAQEPGTARFYYGSRDRQTNSLIPTPGTSRRSFECSVTSLDAFFKERGWPAVHMIKIDVEGAEYAVLRGMTELSARNRNLKLIIEFHPENIRAQHRIEDYFYALQALGFGKISIIFNNPVTLEIPGDIPRLLEYCRPGPFVNLLCERRS